MHVPNLSEKDDGELLYEHLTTALDASDMTIVSRFSPEETMEKLEGVDALFVDLDGTSLEEGATVFPPGFVQKLESLQSAGVRIVFVTGKPESEVRALLSTIASHVPFSCIFERAGYRLDRPAGGEVVLDRLLADDETERTADAIRAFVYGPEIAAIVSGMRIVPAGDGRHRSVVSIDVLRGDAPDDYERHPRFDLKVANPAVLRRLRTAIAASVMQRFPGWTLTDLGNGNFEIHHASQTKDRGVELSQEFAASTGLRMVIDDTRNGMPMLNMKHRHQRMLTGVVFNRHTPQELVQLADMGVAGEATVDRILQQMIEAKGINERIFVISNTPPMQKVKGAFVTSIGAPVAISTAVNGTPQSRWLFPTQTPEDFAVDAAVEERRSLFEQLVPVQITPAQHRSQYGNVANQTLWSAAHPDAFHTTKHFPQVDWDKYQMVNRNIARGIEEGMNGSKDPLIVWVHDFQVAAVAAELGNVYDTNKLRVGFFWHIPFPDAAQFIERMGRPRAKQLLTWFSRYDVVGFHTQAYVDHYHEACALLGVPPAKTLVQPISIDVDGFTEQARLIAGDPTFAFESPELRSIFETVRSSKDRIDVVLDGLERADPIKGTVPRLEAMLELARTEPELLERKIIIEGISESRVATDPLYRAYYDRCLHLIDAINDAAGQNDVIRQVAKVGRRDVIGLLSRVDKAMFTSVADGFNMSCPELLVTWNATREHDARRRTMFVSEQTGFVQSLRDNGYGDAVPVAQGPITAASLVDPMRRLLSDALPEPDYDALGSYFGTYTIQEWVRANVRSIRHSRAEQKIQRIG